MRYLALLTLLIFTLFYSACNNEGEIPAIGTVDSLITEQDAKDQKYDLTTKRFGMQVAIRSDVDGNTQDILDLLDERAADFLECQFMMNPDDIGSKPFQIPSGKKVALLSMLRVFVVPFTFKCEAVDKDTCAGIFFQDSDLIIIAKESLGRCGEFPLWKHELGHRYGMALDHSNISEFESCIAPPECASNDFLNSGVGG